MEARVALLLHLSSWTLKILTAGDLREAQKDGNVFIKASMYGYGRRNIIKARYVST